MGSFIEPRSKQLFCQPVLAGNNLIINAGMLNSESAQSLEKLVIDNEINKMAPMATVLKRISNTTGDPPPR